jgi:hypothetical protein
MINTSYGTFFRLSLSNNTYKVIRAPTYDEKKAYTNLYLGKSQNVVHFGVVEGPQTLRVWILDESKGQMEWILKHQNDLEPLAKHVAKYDFPMDKPWMVHDVCDVHGAAKTQLKQTCEWDSDDDDFLTIKHGAKNHCKHFNILGIHPYKEVVYLADSFELVAYHLNNSKVQYLGYSRPESYDLKHTNGIQESFVYTLCMVGDLNEGNIDQSSY